MNTVALGDIRFDRLPDIWAGTRRQAIVEHLDRGDFSMGCESCGGEQEVEDPAGSYPRQFDQFVRPPGDPGAGWPQEIGFYLSNRCNLQCIQCNGSSSSAIRMHREHLPPLEPAYGDAFFEDLRAFLPHVRHVLFAGGEPFLAPEIFRVADLINELRPGVACTIITNGTQWNSRVRRVLDTMSCSIVVSMDGASPSTFDAIRVGASFDDVVENLGHFKRYTDSAGTSLTINHCLMPQNHHEFGALLLLAEERGLEVKVSVVREPDHCSIAKLPQAEVAAIAASLERQGASVRPQLGLNRATWDAELRRIATWAALGESAVELTGGVTNHRILGFRRSGNPASRAPDEVVQSIVQELTVDRGCHSVVSFRAGPGDTITMVPSATVDVLGPAAESLVGCPTPEVVQALSEGMGPMRSLSMGEQGDARLDGTASFERGTALITLVARRDHDGHADDVELLIGLTDQV